MAMEIIILLGTLAVLLYFFKSSKGSKELKNFSGPSPLPLVGNAPELIRDGKEHVVDVVSGWEIKFGRRFKIFLGLQPYIVITNAEDAEKVLSSQVHINKSRDYDFLMPWLGSGLLTSQAKKWHPRRKLLTPAFHFKILEDSLVVMNEQSSVLVDVLKNVGNKPFNVFPIITHAALDIICESAMGRSINAQRQSDSDYVKAIYRISELIQYRQFRPWMHLDLIWRLSSAGKEEAHCLDILHSFTTKVIKEKKDARIQHAAEGSKNLKNQEEAFFGKKQRLAFLDLLLDAQEKDPQSVQDLDIREETDTFMFEGHDTTAANVNWTIFLLGHFPEAQAKVHDELEQIFGGDKERPVTTEDLTRMKYLELCIKESLRIYPSVPFLGRAIKSDCPLDANVVIPEGAIVLLSTYHLHRDPRFFPNPQEFNPDRFLPDNLSGRHPFAYVPFSAGPRNCIGQKFALMEEKVMLSSVFRNFTVQSVERREDVALLAELIMRPRDGLTIKISSK